MFSTRQAAERLGVSIRRINALINSGELTAKKIGNSWAIDERSVEERLKRPRLLGRPKKGEKDLRNLEAYTLMNRNHEVLDFVYNKRQRNIIEVEACNDVAWAPLGVGVQELKPDPYSLREWISHRYIPSLRPNLNFVLREAELADASDLMFSSWGLNLSDQYWFRPQGTSANWHDINYFENGFSDAFGKTLLGLNQDRGFDLRTPDSATPGALPKRWEHDGKTFRLIKGSSTHEEREPYNEVLATRLFDCLLPEEDYLPYELVIRGGKSYSSCKTLVNANTELITAADIRTFFNITGGRDFFTGYLEALKSLGIPHGMQALEKMLVCDYLMANFDRHVHNFGIIRNSESLDDYRIAPLFDNGAGFFSRATFSELKDRRFTWESHPFKPYPSQQLALVRDISWYDADRLDGFLDEVEETLSLNKNLSQEFIAISVKQVTYLIETVNNLYLERNPLFPGF